MRRIIIIEEDDSGNEKSRKELPYTPHWSEGYICEKCGRRVGCMEYHPCNQPFCGGNYA